MTNDEQTPEGRLIEAAQKRSKLSARKASTLAGLSEGRWRQVVTGYQSLGAGARAPVIAPPETLARMAYAVDIRPDELREVGRQDAADAFVSIYGDDAETKDATLMPVNGIQRLILDLKGTRSYDRLARDCGGVPKANRLHAMATGQISNFPDPDTIKGLSRGLNVSVTAVLLACARSVGLNVEADGADELVLQGAGSLPAESKELLVSMSRQLQQTNAQRWVNPVEAPDRAGLADGEH